MLKQLGYIFETRALHADESYPKQLPANEVAEYLAKKKGKAGLPSLKIDELLITADTTVLHNGVVLNKPKDEEDAISMLHALSGSTHEVITGVAVTAVDCQLSFNDVTTVKFTDLSQGEIHHYIEHYGPFDKAGAYGIQEWIGLIGVEWIKGSYFNVMGLPTHKLYAALKQF